ncbi:MAG: ABC transporter ATP-binding protein [Candidatus Bipolaricaulia bacterium]
MIRVSGLRYRVDGYEILKGIDLEIEAGELVSLVGPNGAGKTTMLLHLSGLLRASAGVVYLHGRAIHDIAPRERARSIAMVRQETEIRFDLNVGDIVTMGRHPHLGRFRGLRHQDVAAVTTALELTDTLPYVARSVRSLSSGERQRVFIARALAQEPEMLLLDEPTANLDLKAEHRIMRLIGSQTEQGMTVITAIHDLNLAARYSDRILLMANGQIVASGTPETVITAERIREVYRVNAAVEIHPITRSIQVTPLP